jgi:hypothetical protein
MADFTVVPADVQNSAAAQIVTGDSAEAVPAGSAVYRLANGKYGLADADGTSPAYKVVGIALDTADGADQPLSIAIDDADFEPGFTAAIGDVIITSDTPGKLAPVGDADVGWFVAIVGIMTTTTHMRLKILRSDAAKA